MKFLQLKAIMSQIFWKEMGPFPMLMAKNLFVFLWVECLMDPPNYLIRKIKSSRLVFCWMASGVVMYGIGYKEVHTSQVKSWTSEATPSATHSHLPNKWACPFIKNILLFQKGRGHAAFLFWNSKMFLINSTVVKWGHLKALFKGKNFIFMPNFWLRANLCKASEGAYDPGGWLIL